MKKAFVLLDFVKYRVAEKILFYRTVIACLENNELFTNPDVELAVLIQATDQFDVDYQASLHGSPKESMKMRESKNAADKLFRKMARYVDRIADGDEAIIANSGFKASHQPKPYSKPLFSAVPGVYPGEIKLRCKAIKRARVYVWQYSIDSVPENEEDWKLAGVSAQVTYTITKLTGLTRYWFRYCAVTFEGMQAWSAPIMKVAE